MNNQIRVQAQQIAENIVGRPVLTVADALGHVTFYASLTIAQEASLNVALIAANIRGTVK